MSDYYFSKTLDQNNELCLAPLSDRLLSLADDTPRISSGYFLFEREISTTLSPVRILAQAVSDEAAWHLKELFELS